MLIPGTPVKINGLSKVVQQEILSCPFPFLSGEQAILSCGREALYFGIRLLKDLPERAHVPAYCCRSVLAPLKKLGIEINFYDVGKHLEPIINKNNLKKGDLFLLIHYFGIPQDVHSIKQLCEKFGLILVEDCAHALPDPESKHPMGSTGDFSIYSLRKQLPVPDGGILVVNDKCLKEQMDIIPKPKIRNTSIKKWLIMTIDKFAFHLGWPNILYIKDALRNKIGSTDRVFYSTLENESVPKVSNTTIKVLSNINIGKIAMIRKRNYYWLVHKLKNIVKITLPFSEIPDGAFPQALPILLKDVDNICSLMRKRGIGVDKWPGFEFPDTFLEKDFPGAFYWNKHLLLMPIHQDLSSKHLEFCVRNLEEILCQKEKDF